MPTQSFTPEKLVKKPDSTNPPEMSSASAPSSLHILLETCLNYLGKREDQEWQKKIFAVLADNLGTVGLSHNKQLGFFTLIDHLLLQAERKIKEGNGIPKEIKLARNLLSQRLNLHVSVKHASESAEASFSEKIFEEARKIHGQPEKYHQLIYQEALELFEQISLLPEMIAQKIKSSCQNLTPEATWAAYQQIWTSCLNDQSVMEAFKKFDRSWRNFSHMSLQKKMYELINIDAVQITAKLEETMPRLCLAK